MLIDWFTVAAQALNFLILVWLMKRYLYKPIRHAIDEREKRIAAELAEGPSSQTALEFDLEIGLADLVGIDVDLNVYRRLLTRRKRSRRVWILERKVLDVLGQHIELRWWVLGRCTVGRGHQGPPRRDRVNQGLARCAGGLTQAFRSNKDRDHALHHLKCSLASGKSAEDPEPTTKRRSDA